MEGHVRETRRVVTALFADLVGSTTLGEERDPEDFQEIVEGAVAAMARPIERFGGAVKEVAGDGVLALFGATAAHEDDAERAILAGLGTLDEVAAYSSQVAGRWKIEGLAVRVGIETGLAVLGPSRNVGSGFEARGDCLNTAARLQAEAAAGEVLAGPSTWRLAGAQFEWGPPRALTLKGKAEEVVARVPLSRREEAERRPPPAGIEAPLVGRDRELALGEQALDELCSGQGGALMVVAEAGIGKTRFVRELRRRLEDRRATPGRASWLEGRCLSYGGSSPYLPFQGIVRDWLAAGPEGEDATVGAAERVRRRSRALLGDHGADQAPFLTSLLGSDPGAEQRAAMERLPPESLQQRITEAAFALLGALAAGGPTVAVFENLQWADASSLGLLRRLAAGAPEEGFLLVLTLRPDRGSGGWRLREALAGGDSAGVREIGLQRLAGEAERDLLRGLVGESVLPETLERELVQRSEGNPFFLEELVRSLVDAGALARAGDGWRFEREARIEIPETIEKVILARIDGLGGEASEALGAAAVLGRQFDAGALAEMVEGELPAASGQVRAALAELERHELVRRHAEEGDYQFRHSLIRGAAYNSLLRRRRRSLHARAAEILERRLADAAEEDRGIVAYHYAAADLPAEAFPRYVRAARASRRIYALAEAIGHYTAALEMSEGLGEVEPGETARLLHERALIHWQEARQLDATRDAQEALVLARETADRALEMEILNDLGFITRATDFEGAVRNHSAALEIARELGDPAAEVRILNRLSLLNSNWLRFDRAVDLAERALALARPLGDDRILARAIDAIKLTAHQLGELGRLERTAAELAEIHRRHGDLWYLQWPLVEGALVPIARARWEEAEARLAEAEELSQRFGGTLGVNVEEARGRIELGRGRFDRALEVAARLEQVVRGGPGTGAEEWVGWAQSSRGSIFLAVGAPGDAVASLEVGIEAAEVAGALNPMLRCTAQLALALRLGGDRSAAAEALGRAEELSARIVTPPDRIWLWGAVAHLSIAHCHLLEGHGARAAGLLAPLLEGARTAGWRELAGRSATMLAGCRLAAGESDAARDLLHEALEAAPDDLLPPVALSAHRLLARLEGETGNDQASAAHRRRFEMLTRRLCETIVEEPERERLRRSLGRELTPR